MAEYNLDRMMSYPRCAVLVSSEEDAEDFVDFVHKSVPDDVEKVLGTGWRTGMKEICYTFFGRNSTTPTLMTHDQRSVYENVRGYKIIPLEDLVVCTDEIQEPQYGIDFLLSQIF